MRVEYLLALQGVEPPTPQCRPVLFALSSADRRRQREVDAARHLLECEVCARLSGPLLKRGKVEDDDVRIRIHGDPDIVEARKQARQLAAQLNFSRTDATLLATAVSEIARNIVRFAGDGLIMMDAGRGTPARACGSLPGTPGRASRTSSGRWPTATAPTTGWAWDCPVPAG